MPDLQLQKKESEEVRREPKKLDTKDIADILTNVVTGAGLTKAINEALKAGYCLTIYLHHPKCDEGKKNMEDFETP